MSYAPGLIVGRLIDWGYFRFPIFAASVLFVTCMVLTAECTQYWQFILCQGFGIGVSTQLRTRSFRGSLENLTSGVRRPVDRQRGVLQHGKHGGNALVQEEARSRHRHRILWDEHLRMRLPHSHEDSAQVYEVRDRETS